MDTSDKALAAIEQEMATLEREALNHETEARLRWSKRRQLKDQRDAILAVKAVQAKAEVRAGMHERQRNTEDLAWQSRRALHPPAYEAKAKQRQANEAQYQADKATFEAAVPDWPYGAPLSRDPDTGQITYWGHHPKGIEGWLPIRPNDPLFNVAQGMLAVQEAELEDRKAQNQADQDKYRSGLPSQEERNAARHARNGPDKPLEYDKYGNLILPPIPDRIK
jgi:hypothetical protein